MAPNASRSQVERGRSVVWPVGIGPIDAAMIMYRVCFLRRATGGDRLWRCLIASSRDVVGLPRSRCGAPCKCPVEKKPRRPFSSARLFEKQNALALQERVNFFPVPRLSDELVVNVDLLACHGSGPSSSARSLVFAQHRRPIVGSQERLEGALLVDDLARVMKRTSGQVPHFDGMMLRAIGKQLC
jgi:hypothetical protein